MKLVMVTEYDIAEDLIAAVMESFMAHERPPDAKQVYVAIYESADAVIAIVTAPPEQSRR